MEPSKGANRQGQGRICVDVQTINQPLGQPNTALGLAKGPALGTNDFGCRLAGGVSPPRWGMFWC